MTSGLFLCALPLVGLVYLAVVVPVVGAWLSGWPSMRAAVRFSALVSVGSAVLSVAASGVFWVLWDRGIVGDKFPFDLRVPDGFDGLAIVEACPTGPDDRVAEVSAQGLGAVRHASPHELCFRHRVDVVEAGGTASQGSLYLCEDDPATGCALLAFGVSRASPWAYPFPNSPLTALLQEARSTGKTVTEVSKAHVEAPDPMGL